MAAKEHRWLAWQRLGCPFPPAADITTDAYRQFVDQNHLGIEILAEVARVDDQHTPDEASTRIQSLIAEGTMPGDIAAAIREHYISIVLVTPFTTWILRKAFLPRTRQRNSKC